MQEIIALSLLLAVGTALGFRFIRDMQSATRARQLQSRLERPARTDRNKYHAVTIAPGRPACPLSTQLFGRRFLSVDAPPLPLPGCGTHACHCRYIHHADRRADDRRFPFGVRKTVSDSESFIERRRGDRRKATALALG